MANTSSHPLWDAVDQHLVDLDVKDHSSLQQAMLLSHEAPLTHSDQRCERTDLPEIGWAEGFVHSIGLVPCGIRHL